MYVKLIDKKTIALENSNKILKGICFKEKIYDNKLKENSLSLSLSLSLSFSLYLSLSLYIYVYVRVNFKRL